ncbi:MAG: TonB-dependent receptor [Gemmatimonadaceae bacterium]|nr:TonB-dependent receptor [Gemmatimonadaceae bacterium]
MSRSLRVAAALCATASSLTAQVSPPQDSAKRDSLARRLTPYNVRATRSEASPFVSPLAITRIGKDKFDAKAGFGLNDAMAGVPGALVQSRYGTSDVRITIRGFGARGAGDRSNAGTSRGIRVLIDGIPETEPDGRTAFDNVDLAAVEGIDVIRSNASALWGNAAGGVVNISTVPVVDRPLAAATVQSGSFGLQRYIAQTAAPLANGGVAYATFVNTTFDGWRVNSDARRVLVNTGIVAPVGEKTRVRVHLTGANNLFHIPGPLNDVQVAADPRQANATYNTRDERRYNRLARLGAGIEQQISPRATVSAMAYINPKYLQRSERGTFRDFTRYHGGANVAYNRMDTVSATFKNRFTMGVDQAYQDGAILFYSLSATAGRGTTLADNKKEGAYNSGVYVEDELLFNSKLALSLGARADGISYYYKSFITPKRDASKTFSQVTPKVGLSYRLTPTHQFYANIGGGVEAPAGNETDPASTFGQDTVTAINPLLEPIRSYTYEVGTKHIATVNAGLITGVSYDVAAYLTNVRNEIVPYRGGRFYFTAGEARRTGLEVSLSAQAKHGFRLDNALTLSKNTYEQYVVDSVHYGKPGAKADYSGNLVVGVPKWFYSSSLVWSNPKAPLGLGWSVGVQGIGDYYADDANTVRIPQAHLLSATLRADRLVQARDVTLKGFVSVENAGDRRFIGSAFLNPDVVGGKPLAFEPGMPRAITVSFSVVRR